MKYLGIPQSGSMAGTVASRNSSGQYYRSRAMPTQPRTAAQIRARASLSDISSAFRSLTPTQIASWNAFGQSFTINNSLGTAIHLTGLQCYTKVNTTNQLNGDALVSVPPALPAFVAPLTTGITVSGTTAAFTLTGAVPAAGTEYQVFVSPALSPGVTFNGKYAWIVSKPTFTSGSANLLTPYEAKYGAPVTGKQYFVKVVQSQAGMQDNGTVYRTIAT